MESPYILSSSYRWGDRFDNEVESCSPLATRFNFCNRLGSPKLYFSRFNTSNAFVNAVDVMERTEDVINVDQLPFDECVPFCAGEISRGTGCTSDPSFDSRWVSLEDVKEFTGLIAAEVGVRPKTFRTVALCQTTAFVTHRSAAFCLNVLVSVATARLGLAKSSEPLKRLWL